MCPPLWCGLPFGQGSGDQPSGDAASIGADPHAGTAACARTATWRRAGLFGVPAQPSRGLATYGACRGQLRPHSRRRGSEGQASCPLAAQATVAPLGGSKGAAPSWRSLRGTVAGTYRLVDEGRRVLFKESRNWVVLVIAVLFVRVFPDLVERYQEAMVGLAGGLIWYYHSRPRVIAHLRISGRTLPIIDIENVGNRVAKNVVVELLPKDFVPRREDRQINREEPIGDMPPGYTREINVPKAWYNLFKEDLDEQEEGRKDWKITVRWTASWILMKRNHSEPIVFGLGTGTVMSDRTLDNWNKMNTHLQNLHTSIGQIRTHLEELATIEQERVRGDVLYLRVGKLFHSGAGPYFVPILGGDQAKELVEGFNSALCPDGTDSASVPECGHSEEIMDRLIKSSDRRYYRWGIDDSVQTERDGSST